MVGNDNFNTGDWKMEGRFDNVELGRPVDETMKRFRRQMAEQLEGIIEGLELPPETTVLELIKILKS
jgi:hypothetical protein